VVIESRPSPGAPPQEEPPELARPGFVVELSTAGFASGSLQGGLFLGARTSPDLIIGGFVDLASSSTRIGDGQGAVTTSSTSFALGAGTRYTLMRAADGHVDLFGSGDVGVVRTSSGTADGASTSLFGLTLAAGLGLRVWVYDNIAVGYLARLRFTRSSGSAQEAGSVLPANGAPAGTDASSDEFGFEGTFQVVGVF
jgi:hypothetical protein